MTNIILASASPRRKEILEKTGLSFKVETSDFNEKFDDENYSCEAVEQMAFRKGEPIAKKHPEDIVISADTVVVYDNKIFLKPKNLNYAVSMLEQLSGKTHFVQTSICLFYSGKTMTNSTKTYVTFNNLTKKMILDYVKTCMPIDKAGAYGIQELPDGFVKNIDGDIENVIGLSSNALINMLQNIKTC